MNTEYKKILLKLRAYIIRKLKPSNRYWMAKRNTKPLSRKFGFDRGTPIDRFFIESFLNENSKFIKGNCLEITDDTYIKKFGSKIVQRIDILDIDKNNMKANIKGDLRDLTKIIKSNEYDCIILTHVLGMIDNYEKAISECKRILKPGGVLLLTVSSFSPTYNIESNFWRFTKASADFVFSKYFTSTNLEIKSWGNVLTGQCFWVGMSQEDLTQKELKYNDPSYPCVISVRAIKEK